jgi:hypothetical protein
MRTGRHLCLLLAILALTPIHAWGNNSLKPTAAEERLLQSVLSGKMADFSKLPDGQRTISAEFMKHLMFEMGDRHVPGNLVHIKGAIIEFFSVEYDKSLTKLAPFELVFDSCTFSSFICSDCRFQRGLKFANTTFGSGGGKGQLVLTGAQINGTLEVHSDNYVTVSLRNARVAENLKVSLPSSSSLDASYLKAGRVDVDAAAPATIMLDYSKADLMYLRIGGDRISGIGLNGAVVDSLSVESRGPVEINSSRLIAKSAGFYIVIPNPESCDKWCFESTKLILTRSSFERGIAIVIRASFLLADSITVKERGTFDVDTKFADLSFSSFDVLAWKVRPDTATDLNGISFKTLNASSAPDAGTHPNVAEALDFLSRANYPISAFAAYQAQLRTQGENADAESAYVRMREKLREREWQHWFTWPLGVIDLFQQYVLGFGHSPVPPMLWSLAFVIFGGFAFRNPTHMQPRVEKPSDYSGAWYSLELFLPIVDLGVAKEWRPKSDSKWRVAYARAHQMAGWVLIPVTLAAITGVVK